MFPSCKKRPPTSVVPEVGGVGKRKRGVGNADGAVTSLVSGESKLEWHEPSAGKPELLELPKHGPSASSRHRQLWQDEQHTLHVYV